MSQVTNNTETNMGVTKVNCENCGGSGLSPDNPLVGCGPCKARRSREEAEIARQNLARMKHAQRLVGSIEAMKSEAQNIMQTYSRLAHAAKDLARTAKQHENAANSEFVKELDSEDLLTVKLAVRQIERDLKMVLAGFGN